MVEIVWQIIDYSTFQVEGPTCENDLSPNAFEPKQGILSRRESAEERSSLEGVSGWRSSDRYIYCGPEPVIAL